MLHWAFWHFSSQYQRLSGTAYTTELLRGYHGAWHGMGAEPFEVMGVHNVKHSVGLNCQQLKEEISGQRLGVDGFPMIHASFSSITASDEIRKAATWIQHETGHQSVKLENVAWIMGNPSTSSLWPVVSQSFAGKIL